jgi:hypothetical protein
MSLATGLEHVRAAVTDSRSLIQTDVAQCDRVALNDRLYQLAPVGPWKTSHVEEVPEVRRHLDLEREFHRRSVKVLEGEAHSQAVIDFDRLLKQDLKREHYFAIRRSEMAVCGNDRAVGGVVGDRGKHVRRMAVECYQERTQVPGVPKVKAGRAFPAAISRDIARKVELAALEYEIVFQHRVVSVPLH